jgi:D-glycerate 3-kinase
MLSPMTSLRQALFEHTPDQKRIDDYYLRVAEWVSSALQRNTKRPYFLGISGPQGSGKSTLAEALAFAFPKIQIRTVTFSADDFYLTRNEQIAVANQYPDNPLFSVRGFAGTHDVDLGARTLASLAAGQPTKIPKYDKSAHDGKGDRAPESEWRSIEGPIDLVIFEGWFLGFHPRPEKQLDHELRVPNEKLAAYAAWTNTLDAFVLLQASDLDFIVKWRVDSEAQRRKKGEKTLSEAGARAYIERFISVYREYVPELAKNPPTKEFMHVLLGEDRQPLTMFGTV